MQLEKQMLQYNYFGAMHSGTRYFVSKSRTPSSNSLPALGLTLPTASNLVTL